MPCITRVRLSALIVLCALIPFVACGDDDSTEEGRANQSTSGDFPVTITTLTGKVTIEERPDAIVSLSPTSTEMLFAIGAGDQVVAVDDQSNYPPDAPATELSGIEPNVEAIAGYEPDVVLISNDTADVVKSLERLDIPVVLHPAAATLEDTYAQMEQLGVFTGHQVEAEAAVATMQSDVDELVQSIPELEKPLTYFHELDDNYFTVTSDTFIGQIYGLVGLRNIADEARGAGSGYPQLSAEYIIESDPDLIFLADTKCCGQSLATVADRPGWDQISAVQDGAVVELDDDIASRWGPRVVDFLRTIVDAIAELEGA